MTSSDELILELVAEHPGMTNKELAAAIGVSLSVVQRHTHKLERYGALKHNVFMNKRGQFEHRYSIIGKE